MSEITVDLDISEWEDFLGKLSRNVKKAQSVLFVAAQAYAFQDIIQHFSDESGPNGKWPDWSPATQKAYAAKGWSGNKILQATGRLRQSLLPGRGGIRKEGSDAVRLFTNIVYGARHNYGGGGIPQREFMWISDAAQEKMASTVAQMILEEAA